MSRGTFFCRINHSVRTPIRSQSVCVKFCQRRRWTSKGSMSSKPYLKKNAGVSVTADTQVDHCSSEPRTDASSASSLLIVE